jgi:hypothetical protein
MNANEDFRRAYESWEAAAEASSVAPLMKSHNFDWAHTGGGCMAWERATDDDGFVWITNDADIDGDADAAEWTVGRYNGPDADEQLWLTVDGCTLAQALALADTLPAPKPDQNDNLSLDEYEARILIAQEFPDYPLDSIPYDIPAWLICCAWHNDTCPAWGDESCVKGDGGITLSIDYLDPAMRDYGGEAPGAPWPRFACWRTVTGQQDGEVFSTDDWAAMRARLEAMRAEVTP